MNNLQTARPRSISASLRFSVFEKCNFRCHYCGCGPPDIQLVVEHVIAVANGGGCDSENLVAACTHCNAGKSANTLSYIPGIPATRTPQRPRGRPPKPESAKAVRVNISLSPTALALIDAQGEPRSSLIEELIRKRWG